MPTRFFRAGVGTVVYNMKGEIAIFRRQAIPAGVWQLQQGGIDLGENPTTTLWRELMEEVGLTEESVASIFELPGWISYEDFEIEKILRLPASGKFTVGSF